MIMLCLKAPTEDLVGQHRDVVLQADEVDERAEALPAVERELHGPRDRPDHEDQEQGQRGADEEEHLQGHPGRRDVRRDGAAGAPAVLLHGRPPRWRSAARRALPRWTATSAPPTGGYFFFAAAAILATTWAGVALPANWSAVALSRRLADRLREGDVEVELDERASSTRTLRQSSGRVLHRAGAPLRTGRPMLRRAMPASGRLGL